MLTSQECANQTPVGDDVRVGRDYLFTMRTTPEERDMLAALAERAGCSAAAYVRAVIQRDHAAAFGEKQAETPRPRAKKKTRK